MILAQYLCHRGSKALTNLEAQAIGIDLKSGWARRYHKKPIPPELASAVQSYIHKGRKAFLKSAAKSVISKQQLETVRGPEKLNVETTTVSASSIPLTKQEYDALVRRAEALNPNYDYIVSDEFLWSYDWRRIRYEALRRTAGKCQCCGASSKQGAVLNVDHIKSRRTHPGLALDLRNLQVLCADCNVGKGLDSTDWRPRRPNSQARRRTKL